MRSSFSVAVLAALFTLPAFAGPLVPPAGPVTPSNKTLQQVEPRTPIGLETTPGDADSLYRITQPGSYYLTGNVLAVAGKHTLQIEADNVTVDLNGFTVQGVAGAPTGIVDHLIEDGVQLRNLTVRNGSVSGFATGIYLREIVNGRFESLQISSATVGMDFQGNAHISNCTLTGCTATGIALEGHGSIVSDCTAVACGTGFTTQGGLIQRSTAASCGTGFQAASARVQGCSAVSCSEEGIILHRSGVAADCLVDVSAVGISIAGGWNEVVGCSIRACTSAGIQVGGVGAVVRNNTLVSIRNNAGTLGTAINVPAGASNAHIEGNVGNSCFFGIVVSGSNCVVVRNSFGGSLANNASVYQFAAGNRFGPLVKAAAGGAVSVSGQSSSVAGSITAADPAANLFW